MPRISIDEIKRTLVQAAKLRGLSDRESNLVAEYYLDAEMRGIKTHGLAKFLIINDLIQKRQSSPQVIKDSSTYALIDGGQELGLIAAQYSIDLLIQKTQKYGIAVVALRNASRYNHLAPFARRIAKSGFVGIVTNSAGPPAVAPHGSYTPVLGTNPISFSFPRSGEEPIVMDFATSKATWGEIRQAILEKRDLPTETFYKADGTFAVNPNDANAVKSFGEAKGYALCLAIEILAGALVGAKMGSEVNDEYDLGFLFFALNPLMFRDSLNDFTSEVDNLEKEIQEAAPIRETDKIRLPGDRSNEVKRVNQQRSELNLDPHTWYTLRRMAEEQSAGMVSSNLTN